LGVKKTIAVIAAAPLTINFFLKDIIVEFEKNYNVIVMTNTSFYQDRLKIASQNVKIIDIKSKRDISFFSDIRTLIILLKHFSKENVSMAYTITPKAGLIGIVAAKIMRVPVRIHNFTGQVWQTKRGIFRYLLKKMDKLIYLLATKVVIDSHSQRDFLINNNIIGRNKSFVIGDGSICGVDTKLFSPNKIKKYKTRELLGIKKNKIVFLYIGRVTIEKGIIELIKAYSKVARKVNNTFLLIVGPNETNYRNMKKLCDINIRNSIKFLPLTHFPEEYMVASDICCLPSYREGFGSVIIESASCEIPAIGTNIYGLKDAIINGETGLLIKVKDIEDLAENMILLANNKDLRKKMGKNGRKRVVEKFDKNEVIKKLLKFIDKELS